MKIKSVENVYLLKRGGKEYIMEEVVNEKGEKVYTIDYNDVTKKADGEEWTYPTDKAKKVSYSELPPTLKKVLKELKSY